MPNAIKSDREYYEIMLSALAGIEDDLLASEAPAEAVEHVQAALALCNADYKRRFEIDP